MSQVKKKYQFEIRDTKTGKLIKRTRKRLCKSFVIGFLKHVEMCFAHGYALEPDAVIMYDTGGVSRTPATSTSMKYYAALEAAGNDATSGIVLGTGSTAVTTGDYAVETPIAHGSGAGQLNYGGTVVGGAVDAGSGTTLTISRQFGNASGDTITIRELCLVCETYNHYHFLLSRDIVNQAVDNGNTVTALIEVSTEL